MVNIGRGVEDVEDSLPRTPLSERGKSMEEKTILIVEDDDACRCAMEKVLQSHGYKTCSCGSGEVAVLTLKKACFDALITDFQLSGIDGFELIKEAREIHPEIFTI
jgi:two-component system sensor histidine kinase EvgS